MHNVQSAKYIFSLALCTLENSPAKARKSDVMHMRMHERMCIWPICSVVSIREPLKLVAMMYTVHLPLVP